MTEHSWKCKTALGEGVLYLYSEMRSTKNPNFSEFGRLEFENIDWSKYNATEGSKFVVTLQWDARQKGEETKHAQLQGKWMDIIGRSKEDNRPVRDLFWCHHADELLEGETHDTEQKAILANLEVLSRAVTLYENGKKIVSGVMLESYATMFEAK